MRALIGRLALNTREWYKGLSGAKKAAVDFGKDVGYSVAVGKASDGVMGLFKKQAKEEGRIAEQEAVSTSSSIKRKLAGAFSAGAIIAVGKASIDSAQRVKSFADQTGLSVEEVQKADSAMKRNSQTMEGFESHLDNINDRRKDAVESDPKLRDNFRKFGITLDDLRDPLQSNLDLAKKMGAALRGMEVTPQVRNSLRDLLGKGGEQFLTALKDLDRQRSPLEFLISKEAVENIDRFTTKSVDLWQALKNLTGEAIGRGLGKLYGFMDGSEFFSSPAKTMAGVKKYASRIPLVGSVFGDPATADMEYRNADTVERMKQRDAARRKLRDVNTFIGPPSAGFDAQQRSQQMFKTQEEKELGKLAFDLAEAQKKTDFDRLSRLGKEKSLREDILGFIKEADFAESQGFDVSAAELRVEAEKKQHELDDLQRQNLPGLKMPFAADSLAQNNRLIGGAATDNFSLPIAIAIQREQLTTLKSIDKKLTPSRGQPATDVLGALNKAFK